MTPNDDFRQQSKLAARANQQVERAFALFMALAASRTPPQEAMENVERAMEVWTPYEDRNRMEHPDYPMPLMTQPTLPITAFVMFKEERGNPGLLKIYADANNRLGVFEHRTDAETFCASINKKDGDWQIGEIGAMFRNAAPSPRVIPPARGPQ